jgi:hypothetical protein
VGCLLPSRTWRYDKFVTRQPLLGKIGMMRVVAELIFGTPLLDVIDTCYASVL